MPRWQEGTGYEDQDLYANLLVDWGETAARFSGSVYWRGIRDLDGVSTLPSDPFRSAYDTYDDGRFNHLFHGYFDLRGRDGRGSARFGRQFLYEGQPFRFDGARYDTREGVGGLKASVFAGVPVYYLEEPSAGEWLAGAGAEVRPWTGGRLGVMYAHIEDDGRLLGFPFTPDVDDLLMVRAGARLGEWGSALCRYTAVEARTRDVLFRALTASERTDTRFSLSYYVQPHELSEFALDISPYYMVQGTRSPFSRIDLCASKGLRSGGWRIGLEALGSARRLSDPADAGEFNRDYDLLRIGVAFEREDRRKFSASVGHAWWWSSGDAIGAFDAELHWRPVDALKLSAGTMYSLYRYEVLVEEKDVRETFVRLRWEAKERIQLRLRYAAKSGEAGRIHRVRLSCAVRF